MDIAQSCGKTNVAVASRSTFAPIASCTPSVAIYVVRETSYELISLTITAGSGDQPQSSQSGIAYLSF